MARADFLAATWRKRWVAACGQKGGKLKRTFDIDQLKGDDVQVVQRAHDMAVRLGVLLGGVGCGKGTSGLEDIARSAEMFHGLSSLVPFG